MAQFAEARAMEFALEIVAAEADQDWDEAKRARAALVTYLEAFTGRQLRELRGASGLISSVVREINGR